MKKRGPLKILFVGREEIGLLIQLELRDKKYGDEVTIALSVSRALEIIRGPESNFDLILPMNYVDEETGSAQEVIRACREFCPQAVIIQIGSFSLKKESFISPPDEVWEASSEIGGLIKMIEKKFG